MTTLREAAQAALRIIELRRNLGNAEYDKQAEQAANDLRAVLAVESVRAALAEFDASLTDPTKISVHQTAEPAQPFCYLKQTSSSENPPHGWAVHFTEGDVALYTAPQPPVAPARLTDADFLEARAATYDVVGMGDPSWFLHYGRAVEAEVLRRMGVAA